MSILGVSLSALGQADTLLNKGAVEMTQASSDSGNVVNGAVDFSAARLEENAGIRVANASTAMNQALLDIFA